MSLSLSLSLFHHQTESHYETLLRENVLERARTLVRLGREKGLQALKPSSDPLIGIGMEVDPSGRVAKNSLGVLDLSWQAAEHPEWPGMIRGEVEDLRASIRAAQGVELRNVIWAGMGGSAEDKAMYGALGLLDAGVRVYILDSTDPAKLQAILAEITRGRVPLARALRQTLVVAMAMGMTSFEPLLNLEKLDLLYRQHGVAKPSNFLYMTLTGSLLDRFAAPRGFRRVELQLDNDNTTAGRHSGPLTRGSLYPLALNGVDLESWMAAAVLADSEIRDAFRMAAFLHGNGLEGRDKVMLLLPSQWKDAGIWTKQDFEESLGKSEELGIKILPVDSAREARDRLFWTVQVDEIASEHAKFSSAPHAVLRAGAAIPLAKYMQWVHYVVFGVGYLRRMNFVTQPSVELYKEIANRVYRQSQRAGKIERTREWRKLAASPYRARAGGGITLYYDSLIAAGLITAEELGDSRRDATELFARALAILREKGKIEYAELTYYGDTRYQAGGRRLREMLRQAGARFEDRMQSLCDVYEGPAMNHSYHEMIIGHGRCFSTVLLSRKQTRIAGIDYRPEYHKAQWLATKLALERRGRAVVAVTFPDLSASSCQALRAFFRRAVR